VDDDLVADLPALHLGADRPDDAGGVGPSHVEGMLVPVEGRDRLAEAGPDAVVVHAPGHDVDQDLVLAECPGRNDLDLEGLFRRAMAIAADRPRIHVGRHMAERRHFTELVEVLQGTGLGSGGCGCHGVTSGSLAPS